LECPRFGYTFVVAVAGVVADVFAGVVSDGIRCGRRQIRLLSVCSVENPSSGEGNERISVRAERKRQYIVVHFSKRPFHLFTSTLPSSHRVT
jgi:hypothetical protein